jgi:hypothetical protein
MDSTRKRKFLFNPEYISIRFRLKKSDFGTRRANANPRKEIHTSKELRLEVHAVEVVDGLIVVGLDLSLQNIVMRLAWC